MYDESRRSPNYWPNESRRRVRLVVWHIADGNLGGTLDWLCNPASDASAQDVIDRLGVVHNIVSGDCAPWTNGRLCKANLVNPIIGQAAAVGINPNWWTYAIECVGYTTAGAPGALTPGQLASLVLRTAQACYYNRLTVDRIHIVGHYQLDSCTRADCPGFSDAEWVSWVEAVYQVVRSWRGW